MANTELSDLGLSGGLTRAHELYSHEGGGPVKFTLEMLEDLLGVRKAALASQVTNSTATLAEVTDLTLTLPAGTFKFEYWLIGQSTVTTTGLHFAVNHTGTVTRIVYDTIHTENGTSVAAVADNVGFGSAGNVKAGSCSQTKHTTVVQVGCYGVQVANSDVFLRLEGIVVASTSGDLELWHCSETANQTSLEVGSHLVVTRIA